MLLKKRLSVFLLGIAAIMSIIVLTQCSRKTAQNPIGQSTSPSEFGIPDDWTGENDYPGSSLSFGEVE